MTNYSLRLETELNTRINPEKSRRFDPARWGAALELLEKILAQDCFALQRETIRIGVIGSNGKGSTAFYLAALCALRKSKIGLFTSPHLLCVRERIRLRTHTNPQPQAISARLAWESLEELRNLLEARWQDYKNLSYFEVLTILAAYIFRKEHCALEIFEAGLGGRFDATRALKASHTVLTVIEREHTQTLGTNPKDILREKLAILHKDSHSLFCMPQNQVSREDIESTAREFAPHIKILFYREGMEEKGKQGGGENCTSKERGQTYMQKNRDFACFVLENLARPFQRDAPVEIPGRLERRSFSLQDGKTKELIFDVAHNPPAILRSLRDLSFQERQARQAKTEYPQRSLVLLALLKDRPLKPNLSAIQQAGFFNIRQILAENWAPAEPGITSIEACNLREILQNELSHSELDRAIFIGTHYSYSHFLDVLA